MKQIDILKNVIENVSIAHRIDHAQAHRICVRVGYMRKYL